MRESYIEPYAYVNHYMVTSKTLAISMPTYVQRAHSHTRCKLSWHFSNTGTTLQHCCTNLTLLQHCHCCLCTTLLQICHTAGSLLQSCWSV